MNDKELKEKETESSHTRWIRYTLIHQSHTGNTRVGCVSWTDVPVSICER